MAVWVGEEVSAWLDWEKIQEQEVERQVEAEVIEAGGFGQSRRRGVKSLWSQIEGNTKARNVLYNIGSQIRV
jgi:hypothetical protein